MTPIAAARTTHRAWLVGLTGKLDQGIVADVGCGQLFDASDKALVRRLVHVCADWQHANGGSQRPDLSEYSI